MLSLTNKIRLSPLDAALGRVYRRGWDEHLAHFRVLQSTPVLACVTQIESVLHDD